MRKYVDRGQVVNRHFFNSMLGYIKTCVVGGEGLTTMTMGDQVILDADITMSVGGARRSPPIVAVLPAIPASGYKEVMWGNSSLITGGTGDNQVWSAYAGQMEWYPIQGVYTNRSGQVV